LIRSGRPSEPGLQFVALEDFVGAAADQGQGVDRHG
jgi:hypothetical protein